MNEAIVLNAENLIKAQKRMKSAESKHIKAKDMMPGYSLLDNSQSRMMLKILGLSFRKQGNYLVYKL